MDVEVLETLIPFFALLSTLVAFVVWLYLRYKARADRQRTLQIALDKGGELTAEFMRELGDPEPSADRDLRRGLVWVAVAIGFSLFGMAIPDDEAPRVMMGISAFPFSIGCAFLLMYFYGARKSSHE